MKPSRPYSGMNSKTRMHIRIVWLGVLSNVWAIFGQAKAPPTPDMVDITDIRARAAGFILRFYHVIR